MDHCTASSTSTSKKTTLLCCLLVVGGRRATTTKKVKEASGHDADRKRVFRFKFGSFKIFSSYIFDKIFESSRKTGLTHVRTIRTSFALARFEEELKTGLPAFNVPLNARNTLKLMSDPSRGTRHETKTCFSAPKKASVRLVRAARPDLNCRKNELCHS